MSGENIIDNSSGDGKSKIFKIVAVGSASVGKTCLLVVYSTSIFPKSYVPTVVDNYEKTALFEGKSVHLEIVDTAGQEYYDQIRRLSYPGTDVFLICFDISNPETLNDVEEKWLPEINENKTSKFILVGTKADLRENEQTIKQLKEEEEKEKKNNNNNGSKLFVSKDEVENFVAENELDGYFETSAMEMKGIDELFHEVLNILVNPKSRKKKKKKKKKKNGGSSGDGQQCVIL